MRELAILGGNPAFISTLHVGRPNIGERDSILARINDMLDRRWLTNSGVFEQELEARVAEMLGVKHCVAMCNATVALEIAIRALGLKGEVIVPSMTFIATAHALQWQEITPVFCDIDPVTHNIDPDRLEGLITPRTSGIIGVHVWGRPCDTAALQEIADRRGLALMYDAAHAFGCSAHGRMVGSFGSAEVFSFHATKFINSFEGGAITTNDAELAKRLRLMKNFGFAGYDKVVYLGTNGKMSEASAAMGLASMESMDRFIATNRANYDEYASGLDSIPGISLMPYDDSEKCNYQYVVIECDPKIAGLTRDELLAALHAENVFARRYFYPGCHRMEPYRSLQPNAGLLLPETEALVERIIILPTGTAVSTDDVAMICGIFREACKEHEAVRRAAEMGSL
jgi:dTDP-4-amino-4,6-dideoxygalactose transaminase